MDKYTRVKQIGEGAFGKAVLVRAKETGEKLVVKEIHIGRMTSKEKQDARKEVAVLAQLKHPNIVTYKESFEERGGLYIVMDYCSGGDLYSKINSQRGLLFQEEQVWTWFVQLCLAIKHIHDRKILHRDIKSQNVFLASDGSVRIGDFGIAKVLNSTVELARTCIGTPYYLSPEIVENKPYNNKSDIWSLGCVLYELTTLKHAFEAGNMKNLVLKIIRGSYPPIPPKYSYELRGLIAQLFKRAPRDRPSINSILKKNFIISRARGLLSEEKMKEEFSHTLLHGQKIARALPPPPRPASAGPKRVTPSPRPGSAAGRYNPAAVYGAPLVKKSKEIRPGVKKKNASGDRLIPGQQDWEKRKRDMILNENKRREELKKKEQEMFARKHKDLVDKQKVNRMNRAREEGWKQLMNSDDDSKPSTPAPAYNRPLPMPGARPAENQVPLKERGNYEQYNAYLNRIRGDKNARVQAAPPVPAVRNNAAPYMAAPKPVQANVPKADRDYFNRAIQDPAYDRIKQTDENRRAAAQASERARLAQDFLQRKREAQLNKQRGHAQMYGYTPPATPVYSRPNSAGGGKSGEGVNARNKEEQDYLEKLRQIRQQNMKERRMLQGKVAEEKKPQNDNQSHEARKKKTEALRKQADEWSQKKKQQLEKEKKEILDRMRAREEYMKQREEQKDRPVTPKVNMKPAAAVPITGALHAIGVGKSPERPKSAVQQKKDHILKRLNEKGDGRGQWENPRTPDLAMQTHAVEGEDEDGSDTARSQWGDVARGELANLPLEQTASQMEATSAADRVIKLPARNQWGKPGGTVVGVLQGLPITDATMTIASNKSDSSTGSDPPVSPSPGVPPISSGVGATITISRAPIQKGTITISISNKTAISAAKGVEADTAEKTVEQSSEDSDLIGQPANSSSNEIKDVEQAAEGGNIDQSETLIQSENTEAAEGGNIDQSETLIHSEKDEAAEVGNDDQSEPAIQNDSKGAEGENVDQSKPAIQSAKDEATKGGNIDQSESAIQSEEVKAVAYDDNSASSVQGDDDVKPVIISAIQPLPTKPKDEFPKPKLLPKPNITTEFFVSAPDVVREEGPGSLFDKVELEEDEEEGKKGEKDKGKDTGDGSGDCNKFVTKGISTGLFDLQDFQLMRTASEPDLQKLSLLESPAVLRRHKSMDLSVVQEETYNNPVEESRLSPLSDDDLSNTPTPDDQSETPTPDSQSETPTPDNQSETPTPDNQSETPTPDNQSENRSPSSSHKDTEDDHEREDGDVSGDVIGDVSDDDDDLISVMASMQSLLLDNHSGESELDKTALEEEETKEEDKEEGTGPEDTVAEKKDIAGGSKEEEDDQEESEEAVKADGGVEEVEEEHGDDDGDDVEEYDEDDDELRDLQDDEEGYDRNSSADLFDDSDGETQFGDDDDDDSDLFSRLEQQRADLEAVLGDKLIEVYNAVQAMQEDEDANIEDGARIAMEMLGKEHEHLYPKIFQLVLSDTAYTEDNL